MPASARWPFDPWSSASRTSPQVVAVQHAKLAVPFRDVGSWAVDARGDAFKHRVPDGAQPQQHLETTTTKKI